MIGSGRLSYARSSGRLVLKFTLNRSASVKVKLERRVGTGWRIVGRAIRATGRIGANRTTIRLRQPRVGRYRVTLTAVTNGQRAKLIKTITVR